MAVPDLSDRSLAELVSLKGRRAVITAGARNIGFASARRLAEAGARVMIADIDEERAAAAADYLAREQGADALGIHVDVTDATSVAALADRAVAEFGGIDIWVNNAGLYPFTAVLEISDDEWDRVLAVNLRGAFIGAREAARRMVAAGRGGVIINMGSQAAFRAGGTHLAHYVAAKHGVRGLTQSLAVELGPHGIRVLAVAPTLIERRGVEDVGEARADAGQEEPPEHLVMHHPLGRAGVPDDVARVVLFCASDLSMLMSGSMLAVDAGSLAV